MNIKLKINGRDTSPDSLGSAVEDAILAKVKSQVAEKLKDVRCPEHGQAPKIKNDADTAPFRSVNLLRPFSRG